MSSNCSECGQYVFNPWYGCTPVSPGCDNCPVGKQRTLIVASEEEWLEPLKWQKKAAKSDHAYYVECGTQCDWADENAPSEVRERMWKLIRRTPDLEWHLTTKRPENLPRFLPKDWGHMGYLNVSLGVSVENREHGLPRLDILRKIQGASRTVEFVPLLEDLGDIDLSDFNLAGPIRAERGRKARPMQAKWAKAILSQCKAQGCSWVDFHF